MKEIGLDNKTHNGNSTMQECPQWPTKQRFCFILHMIQLILPSLSAVGCIFIILVIWLFKLYHSLIQRLILSLTVSAFFLSGAFLVTNIESKNHNSMFCYTQAFMIQFFLWAVLSWVVLITINMFFNVYQKNNKGYEKYFHLLAWINSCIWTIIPFLYGGYGHAGIWCWITKEHPVLRLVTWYLPLFIACFLMMIAYVFLFWHNNKMIRSASTIYRAQKYEQNKVYKREVKPLIAFPLIYCILTVPSFVCRLYEYLFPVESLNFGLVLITVLCASFVGLANALAYAYFSETFYFLKWKKLKQACHVKAYGKSYKIRKQFSIEDFHDKQPRHSITQIGPTEPLKFLNKIYRRCSLLPNSGLTNKAYAADEKYENASEPKTESSDNDASPLAFHNSLFDLKEEGAL